MDLKKIKISELNDKELTELADYLKTVPNDKTDFIYQVIDNEMSLGCVNNNKIHGFLNTQITSSEEFSMMDKRISKIFKQNRVDNVKRFNELFEKFDTSKNAKKEIQKIILETKPEIIKVTSEMTKEKKTELFWYILDSLVDLSKDQDNLKSELKSIVDDGLWLLVFGNSVFDGW
jgi:YesN/AraC family two-component response regulator